MMFPWEQPRRPIEDPDRRREAAELLAEIKQLDAEGERWLERLADYAVEPNESYSAYLPENSCFSELTNPGDAILRILVCCSPFCPK